MNRFLPDTWLDLLMRPFDMAAPEANVYVETVAPDVRLAIVLLLALALGALWLWRRRASSNTPVNAPVVWLTVLLLVSMVPWFITTGNGRYFIAWLVLLGPLCVGLLRALPFTAGRKLALAVAVIGMQLFVLSQNTPFGQWTWIRWEDPPYFQIAKPPAESATYVTIASLSYTLVAPQFPVDASWINVAAGVSPRDAAELDKRLSSAHDLKLFAPAIPSQVRAEGQPSLAARKALAGLLKPHGVLLAEDTKCSFLRSGGLARIGVRAGAHRPENELHKYGFWICPVTYKRPLPEAPDESDPAVDAVFEAVEHLCPRFFPAGGHAQKTDEGWVKHYDTDTIVYLFDDGTALFKFWRSINPVVIGKREQLLAGKVSLDCTKIRAPNWRHGGP